VTVNCAAIPRELVESEMFGHERGAFTGAAERRLGRFELADGGTLFLDEIGDLNLEAQAKLLRTLETGILQRLGAEQPTQVNVRVVAATNRRLDQAVAAGTFREDLFFRLNIFPIHLPPLRERIDDLPALVAHLAQRVRPGKPQVYSAEAMALLRQYPWPGNIRELANLVERLAILGGPTIGPEEIRVVLPEGRLEGARRSPGPATPAAEGSSLTDALDDYERELIGAALKTADGNVAEAARLLVTDRANLYRRMKRLGLATRGELAGGER
jgi:two-component system nitrogen regulation response regulator NtrX